MSNEVNDTGWKDIGNGVQMRTVKYKAFKPFSWDDMQNTWCTSIPDGKGNVTNTFGKWVDGKMVEDFRETIIDPLDKIISKLKNK